MHEEDAGTDVTEPVAPAGLVKITCDDVANGYKFVVLNGEEHKASIKAEHDKKAEHGDKRSERDDTRSEHTASKLDEVNARAGINAPRPDTGARHDVDTGNKKGR